MRRAKEILRHSKPEIFFGIGLIVIAAFALKSIGTKNTSVEWSTGRSTAVERAVARPPSSLEMKARAQSRKPSARPQEEKATPSSRQPARNPFTEKPAYATSDIRREVRRELSQEALDDMASVFSSENRERDFLLNEVGLSKDQYLEVERQRSHIYSLLQAAPEFANQRGLNPEKVKKAILAKHVEWMQSYIGVGNYDLLQEIAASELGVEL